MKKYRRMYAAVVVCTLLLLFFFSTAYLLALFLLEIALVLFLHTLLHLEMRSLTTKLSIRSGCMVGESCPMIFEFYGKTPFVAAGALHVVIEFQNALYGRSVTQELKIPSTRSKKKYEILFTPVSCGEEHIVTKEIVCYDVFGITSVRLTPMTEQVVVVVPKSVPIRLTSEASLHGRREGEQYDYRKKGMDTSEVFDLREYQPGDDVRFIHWKLSGKLDHLLVKEPAYSSHYDTIVLFDGALGMGEKLWEEHVVSGALEFAIAFSDHLLEISRAHCVAALMNESLVVTEVTSYYDLIPFIQQNMGVPLPKQGGGGLSHFLMQHLNEQYSRVIYIAAGAFPEELYALAKEQEVTAVCITDTLEDVRTVKKGKSSLIEIPCSRIYEQVHHFYV